MTFTIGGKEYKDVESRCIDCGRDYIFTAGEQEFFETKGFTPPKRCKPCRIANKDQKEQRKQERAMRGMPDGPHGGHTDRRGRQ